MPEELSMAKGLKFISTSHASGSASALGVKILNLVSGMRNSSECASGWVCAA